MYVAETPTARRKIVMTRERVANYEVSKDSLQ